MRRNIPSVMATSVFMLYRDSLKGDFDDAYVDRRLGRNVNPLRIIFEIVGTKKILTIKSFLTGLILSKILTSICVALIVTRFDRDITFLQSLIVLLLSGTSYGFIIHLGLFCIYFFTIKLIVTKITSPALFVIFLVLSGALYFAIVTFTDWNISKRSFKDFESYMSHGGYYPIYAMVVVFILITMGIKSRNALKNNMR